MTTVQSTIFTNEGEGAEKHTLLPFSMSARSQTEISAANLWKSLVLASSSSVHVLMISSRDLPLSIDGGGTAIAAEDAVLVLARLAAGAAVSFLSISFDAKAGILYLIEETKCTRVSNIQVSSFFSAGFPNKLKLAVAMSSKIRQDRSYMKTFCTCRCILLFAILLLRFIRGGCFGTKQTALSI